jgi:acetate kinase
MKILVLNSGSSSQKSALFEIEPSASSDPVAPLWEGKLEWDGKSETLTIRNIQSKSVRDTAEIRAESRQARVEKMLQHLCSGPTAVLSTFAEIAAAGHRIVHGGPQLTEPALVTAEVKQAISDVSAIVPLHNQAGLQGIELIEKLLPGVRQVAVFDTGFHRTLPLCSRVYPGPYQWYERGIQRYGFHGINHQYCAHRTAQLLGRDISSLKTVTCHLGNGCSLAAIHGGHCVDTTMGFTPLEGLMMGTRSGSIDPGILTFLLRTQHADTSQLDAALNHQSGLLGISGVSSDMREILSLKHKGNERAELAFEIFVHRLQAGIGAMTASLTGLDALVFTAGIGENSPEVRQVTCEKLGFLGIELDEETNSAAKPDREISSSVSKVRVLVIRAQEDWAIAQECARLYGARNS